MRRPNPWDSRAGLRIEAAESGARGGKSRGRHMRGLCFSCSPDSPFLRVHTKRQRLRPQIGRRRCLALIIARRMRTGGTFPRPMFWRESGERRLTLHLLASQSIFCASIQKGSAFVHKSVGGAALRLFYRTSKEKRWHFSAPHVSVGIRRISAYSPLTSRA